MNGKTSYIMNRRGLMLKCGKGKPESFHFLLIGSVFRS